MARPKNKRKITEGGYISNRENLKSDSVFQPDIILQMPEIFHFDMKKYITALRAGKAIDFYSRTLLYDMYESALLDLHLSGIIDKRKKAVTRIPIEFRRDGKPDDAINVEIHSPWFRHFLQDALMSIFWGYSLFQFYRDNKGYIQYYKVPYKHYDPVKRQILRYQSDNTGIPVDAFENMLYVGNNPRDLGMLAELVPMVLYKRGNMGDWAQFCQIFGMPVREYTYDAGDEETRLRLLKDARQQGANAVYIHPKESALNLIESANKSGTVDLYERFSDKCDSQMSIRVLGNTLTTDAKSTGTQALGTVHQEEENELKEDDKQMILDILNYEMTDIFSALGLNTEGGEFVYVKSRVIDPSKQVDVISKAKQMGLPISHEYMYEVLQIDRPENYEELKAQMDAEQETNRQLQVAMAERMQPGQNNNKGNNIDNKARFFVEALQDRAVLKF